MAIVAGDFTEISYNHPTLGTGFFYPVAGEDGSLDTGGFRTEDDNQAIAGNGEAIDKMKRTRWSYEDTLKWDMSGVNDIDMLTKMTASVHHAVFTFTHVSGAVWQATGKPVGDIVGSGQNASIPIKFSGGGVAKKTMNEL